MLSPAPSGDVESSGARSWSSTEDLALPIPGAQAVAQTSRDRHVTEQPAGKHKASCSPCKACRQGLLTTCLQLLHKGSQGTWPLCAQCSTPQQPPTQKWDVLLQTPSRPGDVPTSPDSSTSHMQETQGEGWIKQEKGSLNSLKAVLGPKQNTAGPGDPSGWLGWPHHN